MINNERTKMVTIETSGTISELGGISGPIINPCPVPISTIVRLINGHKNVYEVDMATGKKVRLTLRNVNGNNFPVQNKKVEKPVIPSLQKTTNNANVKSVDNKSTVNDASSKSESKANTTKKDEAKTEIKNDFTKK